MPERSIYGEVEPQQPAKEVDNISSSSTIEFLRCWKCDKLLAQLISTPYNIMCPRCKSHNKAGEQVHPEFTPKAK